MTLQELKTQLHALTPGEKADVIQMLTQTLSQRSQGITKTPGVMGSDVCITNTRLTIWLFVSLRHQGAINADVLKA
jgi:uncharacterized protein (DUF433 family)